MEITNWKGKKLLQLKERPKCNHSAEDNWWSSGITMEWGGDERVEYHCCGSVFDKTGFLGVIPWRYERWLRKPPFPKEGVYRK